MPKKRLDAVLTSIPRFPGNILTDGRTDRPYFIGPFRITPGEYKRILDKFI